MVTDKINELIGKAIDNSNLEKKDFLALNNKTISIILKNTSTILYIVSQEEKFKLVEEIDNEPDLVLEGSPIAFINYINNVDTASSIKISGDASLAESFSNITQKIDINWEQIISEYTNDDIAFYSSKIFEFIKSFISFASIFSFKKKTRLPYNYILASSRRYDCMVYKVYLWLSGFSLEY